MAIFHEKEASLKTLQGKATELRAQIQTAKDSVKEVAKRILTSETIAALEQGYQGKLSTLSGEIQTLRQQLSMTYSVVYQEAPLIMMPMYPAASAPGFVPMGASVGYPHAENYLSTRGGYSSPRSSYPREPRSLSSAASGGQDLRRGASSRANVRAAKRT